MDRFDNLSGKWTIETVDGLHSLLKSNSVEDDQTFLQIEKIIESKENTSP